MKPNQHTKSQAVTPAELEAAYQLCLKRERNRLQGFLLSEQGKFEQERFERLDLRQQDGDNEFENTPWLSDCGKGVEAILDAFDDPLQRRLQNICRARQQVTRLCPEVLPVFWALVRNGTKRDRSIAELAADWRGVRDHIAKLINTIQEASCKRKGAKTRKRRHANGQNGSSRAQIRH